MSGSGGVVASPSQASYAAGTSVTLTAAAAAGWSFAGWSGSLTGNSNPAAIVMNGNKAVTATFTQNPAPAQYTLTMAMSGSGTVAKSPDQASYTAGTSVTLTAAAVQGWAWGWWGGDLRGPANPAVIVMNGNKVVSATFNQIMPAGGGGEGGGGGGWGAIDNTPSDWTSLLEVVNSSGKITVDTTAKSPDENVHLTLTEGTVASDPGSRLTGVYIRPLRGVLLPSPSDAKLVSVYYELGPEEFIFTPPANLTFKYEQSKMPEGCDASKLYIGNWDEANQKWIKMESSVNKIENFVQAKVPHLSIFAVMVGTKPAAFTVNGLSVTAGKLYKGNSVEVSAAVTNTGDLAGSYDAALKINNVIETTKKLTLNGGEKTTVSFKLTAGDKGTYALELGGAKATFSVEPAPASFKVSSLNVSAGEVVPGDKVSIGVTIANIGEAEGNYNVSLKINDIVRDTKALTLAGGASQAVSFTAAMETPGKNKLDINGVTGELTVKDKGLPPVVQPAQAGLAEGTPQGNGLAVPPWLVLLGVALVGLIVLLLFVYRREK